MDIEQARREDARWKMLRIVDAGRPVGVNEGVIARVLADESSHFTRDDLRRELAYLEQLGLIEVGGQEEAEWFVKTTARGVDVVEYTAPAPAGIARPSRRG